MRSRASQTSAPKASMVAINGTRTGASSASALRRPPLGGPRPPLRRKRGVITPNPGHRPRARTLIGSFGDWLCDSTMASLKEQGIGLVMTMRAGEPVPVEPGPPADLAEALRRAGAPGMDAAWRRGHPEAA